MPVTIAVARDADMAELFDLYAHVARGFEAIVFNLVRESKPARSIYERAGFEVTGRVPGAFTGEDALIYWRAL